MNYTHFFGAAVTAAFLSTSASAAVVDMLGDMDFTDGQTVIGIDVTSMADGDPAPFNQIFGFDGSEAGSLSYTHSFDVVADAVSASIMIGLIDHDSFDILADTVDIFFDGVAQDTTIWQGISIDPASASIRSMDVDLAFLADGMLTVEIFGTDVEGQGENAIAVDFSALSVEVAAVPLPASGLLLLGGLGAFGLRRRKK